MARFTHFSLTEHPGARAPASDHPASSSVLPDMSDLSSRLRFVPQEGQVWLDDQRFILLNLAAMTCLRRELIESVGPERAREILFRMGHVAGAREARLAMKVRSGRPQLDAFLVGPQLHALRGEVYVEPVAIEADVESGQYFSELIWKNSAEAETHVVTFGPSSQPVCWMQIGYASGYTSTIMERPILFREVECIACGSETCRIVGKPTEEWPDAIDLTYMPRTRFKGHSSVRSDLEDMLEPEGIVGASPGFLSAWHLMGQVAPLKTTVLLLGETGVGKEIFARAVHVASPRKDKPLYSVNCAAMPESLIEAELFGAERGAFTGANVARKGWFEVADGSTLFLDEIGTLTLPAQAKLLRVLQEGKLTRIGGTVVKQVDVRVVCATNIDLEHEVKRGTFRSDLFYRINIFPIKIPPLRERRDDIAPLIEYFLGRFNAKTGRKVSGFKMSAVDALLLYEFPGNVRELENMIERAAILTRDNEPIDVFHLFNDVNSLHRTFLTPRKGGHLAEHKLGTGLETELRQKFPTSLKALAELEEEAIERALLDAKGNVSRAARTLGLTRAQLRYRLQRTEQIRYSKP